MHLFGCAGVSRVSVSPGFSLVAVRLGSLQWLRLLQSAASLERAGFSSCSTRAQEHKLSSSGVEPAGVALAGRFNGWATRKVLGRCFYPAIPSRPEGWRARMSAPASVPCFLLTLLSILHHVEGAGGHSSHRAGLSPSHPEVFVLSSLVLTLLMTG